MPANRNSVEFNPVLSFLPFPIKGIRHENYTDQTPVPDGYADAGCGCTPLPHLLKPVNWSLNPGTVRKVVNKQQWKRNNGTIRVSFARKSTNAEKEWDKADTAFDSRDKCEQSANINAYWEPNTLRCLDRRTGRTVAP
jgi:hypothetical protein